MPQLGCTVLLSQELEDAMLEWSIAIVGLSALIYVMFWLEPRLMRQTDNECSEQLQKYKAERDDITEKIWTAQTDAERDRLLCRKFMIENHIERLSQ
jgi:hypothetical protein